MQMVSVLGDTSRPNERKNEGEVGAVGAVGAYDWSYFWLLSQLPQPPQPIVKVLEIKAGIFNRNGWGRLGRWGVWAVLVDTTQVLG